MAQQAGVAVGRLTSSGVRRVGGVTSNYPVAHVLAKPSKSAHPRVWL